MGSSSPWNLNYNPTTCRLVLFMLFIKQEEGDAVNYKAITQTVTTNLGYTAMRTLLSQEELALDRSPGRPWAPRAHPQRAATKSPEGDCLCRRPFLESHLCQAQDFHSWVRKVLPLKRGLGEPFQGSLKEAKMRLSR